MRRSAVAFLSFPALESGRVIVQPQNGRVVGEMEFMLAGKLGNGFPEKSEYSWVLETCKLCE